MTILEDVKGQVRFNTKLLQNVLEKIEATATCNENTEVDLGIEFPLKSLEGLQSPEEQLECQETTKIMVTLIITVKNPKQYVQRSCPCN